MPSADERVRASPLYEKVKERIQALRQLVKDLYRDGKISLADGQLLVRRVIQEASGLVKDIDASDGDRRQLFIDICVTCWKDVGEPIKLIPDIKWVPGKWIEKRLEKEVVDPALGSIVDFGAAVIYDYVAGP